MRALLELRHAQCEMGAALALPGVRDASLGNTHGSWSPSIGSVSEFPAVPSIPDPDARNRPDVNSGAEAGVYRAAARRATVRIAPRSVFGMEVA